MIKSKIIFIISIINFCCCSVIMSCLALCDPMGCSIPGSNVIPYLPEFKKKKKNSYLLSQWCHPTILSSVVPFSSCPQSFSSLIFSSESALCIRRPKYWSFSFSISPSNKYSGYISFGINRFDILTVSVQFSRSVMSNSLWPHEFQDARPPCASSTPEVHPNSRPLSR